ncbi:MAG: hypothetical protein ACTSR0_00525 [Candidatus Asgardarchaeia archaeon]
MKKIKLGNFTVEITEKDIKIYDKFKRIKHDFNIVGMELNSIVNMVYSWLVGHKVKVNKEIVRKLISSVLTPRSLEVEGGSSRLSEDKVRILDGILRGTLLPRRYEINDALIASTPLVGWKNYTLSDLGIKKLNIKGISGQVMNYDFKVTLIDFSYSRATRLFPVSWSSYYTGIGSTGKLLWNFEYKRKLFRFNINIALPDVRHGGLQALSIHLSDSHTSIIVFDYIRPESTIYLRYMMAATLRYAGMIPIVVVGFKRTKSEGEYEISKDDINKIIETFTSNFDIKVDLVDAVYNDPLDIENVRKVVLKTIMLSKFG